MTIEELKQALEAATPGPWEWQEDRWHGGYSGISNNQDKPVLYPNHANEGDWGAAWFDEDELDQANARLIVAAGNNLPALLKAVEAAREVLVKTTGGQTLPPYAKHLRS